MKKRINLLVKQKKYTHLEQLFGWLRLSIIVLVAIFLFLSFFYYVLFNQKKQEADDLQSQKQELLNYLVANKEVEAKFVFFRNKQKQLSDVLQEDVNFYPYYNLLNDSLKSATPEPHLESVVIDQTKNAVFKVSFDNYESLLSFFKFAESERFLQNFSQLSLSNFQSDTRINNNFQLEFKGSFVALE